VSGVDAGPPDGGDGTAFVVRAADAAPVQRALAAAVVARGWTLLEVRATTPTLEDLFVRLVSRGAEGR
jgi:UDP-N-acetylglucosamine enolpyruvyl transferase